MSDAMMKGKEIVVQAIKADELGDIERASKLYRQSLSYFILSLKYEKNPKIRELLTGKIEGYLARAEALKEAIEAKHEKMAKGKDNTIHGEKKKSNQDENEKFAEALSSAIVREKPNVKWDDVAGLEGAKEALKEAVSLPILYPQFFTGKRKPWKGILLYGPPGTGKSYLAKAVATEAEATFFSVSSSDLVSKWVGESEKLIKTLFQMARENKPSIIFIDEIDSLAGTRTEGENESTRRIKNEILAQTQGVAADMDKVLILGATNTPWSLDPAVRRRFEKRIYIPLPDIQARAHMFKLHVGDTPSNLNEKDFDDLAARSDGYSGSDVSVVVRDALMEPLREWQNALFFKKDKDGIYSPIFTKKNESPCPKCPAPPQSAKKKRKGVVCPHCQSIRISLFDIPENMLQIPVVTKQHFLKALQRVPRSVSQKELGRFVDWTAQFGQEGV